MAVASPFAIRSSICASLEFPRLVSTARRGRGEPLPDAIGVERLVAIVRDLGEGVTELGCHPGEVGDLESSYVAERELEVEALFDPRVRAAVEDAGVELRSFRDAFGDA